MSGKLGRSGRLPSASPKRRQVGFRLDETIGELFDQAVLEAAKEAPPGVKFTASDYLRGLFLRDAEARRLKTSGLANRPKSPAKVRELGNRQ